MHQIIDQPTHITNTSAYILDLIFVDKPHFVVNHGVNSPLCDLDQCTIYCKLKYKVPRQQSYERTTWDYKTADIAGLNDAFISAHIDIFLVYLIN